MNLIDEHVTRIKLSVSLFDFTVLNLATITRVQN